MQNLFGLGTPPPVQPAAQTQVRSSPRALLPSADRHLTTEELSRVQEIAARTKEVITQRYEDFSGKFASLSEQRRLVEDDYRKFKKEHKKSLRTIESTIRITISEQDERYKALIMAIEAEMALVDTQQKVENLQAALELVEKVLEDTRTEDYQKWIDSENTKENIIELTIQIPGYNITALASLIGTFSIATGHPAGLIILGIGGAAFIIQHVVVSRILKPRHQKKMEGFDKDYKKHIEDNPNDTFTTAFRNITNKPAPANKGITSKVTPETATTSSSENGVNTRIQ